MIQNQEKEPIKRIRIANVASVSPRTVTNSLERLREQVIVCLLLLT